MINELKWFLPQAKGEPIKERKVEFEGRNLALNELSVALQHAKMGYDQIKASQGKEDKYSHITDDELKQAGKAIQEKWTWLDEAHVIFAGTPRTQLPSITVSQIRSAKQVHQQNCQFHPWTIFGRFERVFHDEILTKLAFPICLTLNLIKFPLRKLKDISLKYNLIFPWIIEILIFYISLRKCFPITLCERGGKFHSFKNVDKNSSNKLR